MKEICYGIIPLQIKDSIEVLMVHHQKGHWSFPKGHAEKNELPRECAKRELKEEVGLDIKKFLEIPSIEEKYHFFREGEKVEKGVIYFFALVQGTLYLQEAEIAGAKWLSLVDAYQIATFPEAKKVVLKIQEIFNNYPLTIFDVK